MRQFRLDGYAALRPRYNIAPTQPVAVVRADADGRRELSMLRWGLVPGWADDPSIGNRMINARAETLAEKPAFRSAFKQRRCLVLADGYYEWQKRGKTKQPFLFHMEDEHPFALAGLWESWTKIGEPLESCTIITTSANSLASQVYDRMPAILGEAGCDAWLDAARDPASLAPLLAPYPMHDLVADPVSTIVNRPANEVPACVEPLSGVESLLGGGRDPS